MKQNSQNAGNPPVLHLAALVAMPLLLFCASLVLKSFYGPYFLGRHLDPEYAYLLNSLNIIHFIVPGHTDHPGTTLQLLGAVGLLLKWFGHLAAGGQLGIDEFVLRNPEESLAAINLIVNALVFAAFVFASFSIYRSMRGLLPVLVFQLSLLVPLQVKVSLVRVNPEPLLVFTVLLLAGLVVRYRNPATAWPSRSRLPLLIGMTMGFGLASKVTFLPVLLLILLFSPGRERMTALSACVMSFLLFTLPITTKFPQMLAWFGSIAAHNGRYGSGAVGMPPVANMMENLLVLVRQEPSFFIFLVFYLAYLLVRKYSAGESATGRSEKLLLLGSSVMVAQILMTVKHPAVHYMLPSIAMTALLNAQLYALLKENPLFPIAHLGRGLLCIVAIAGTYCLYSVKSWVVEAEKYRANEAEFSRKIAAIGGYATASYYRASTLPYALSFGNDFSGTRYGKELSGIHPGMVFYNMWSRQFCNYQGVMDTAAVAEMLKREGGGLLLVGMPLGPEEGMKESLKLKPVIETPYSMAYELEGFNTSPHANDQK